MRHNCTARIDDINPFEEAVVDGAIEYDDWYNCYVFFGYLERRFLFWRYGVGRADVLSYCPYCGEKICEDNEV